MRGKKEPVKHNPIAKLLSDTVFKSKVVKSKLAYNRSRDKMQLEKEVAELQDQNKA